MVLRRPILLRWTNYMDESVRILENSPEAFPSDRLLCQQVKMAHVSEKISVEFSMDDPTIEVSISDPKVIYAIKIFENELNGLKEENSLLGNADPTLTLAEHVTSLYLHEIALHQHQGSADLQPPFESDALSPSLPPLAKRHSPVGPAHIGALGDCLNATHGILDTILSIELDILLTLPVIFCVRAIYAIVCLMKMWVSVMSSGEVGSIIKKEDLQIEAYTEQLVAMFNAIVSRDAQSPHGKFYFVAKRLEERFAHIKEGAARESQAEAEYDSGPPQPQGSKPPVRPSSTSNQTPLHLLSEVAMGSSNNNNAASQQQQQQQQQQTQSQTQAHSRSQQQAQAALQAHAQHSQQAMNWYSNMATTNPQQQQQPTPDLMGLGTTQSQVPYDINFDFTSFDIGNGSDADLSALFIPDSMGMWGYPDPNLQGYMGF